jgi:ABC-type amino acid transport substrate-binding protein
MKLARLLTGIVLLCPLLPMTAALPAPVRSAHELEVVYPLIEERPRDSYGYKVLELALAKSGRRYRLTVSKELMSQERARASLEDGRISVFDTGASAQAEERLRAVYFPIDRGISGYRLFIVNRALSAEFAAIKDLDGLRLKTAGQGPGWADVKILENAGIKVQIAPFGALFAMADNRRFDFYPLGLEEVYGMLDKYRERAPGSVVEETLVLHYPFARLFFVNKGNLELHDALLAGLQAAFADGSFQKLLENDPGYKAARQRANIAKRTIIEVENPELTPRFKAIPAKYFAKP